MLKYYAIFLGFIATYAASAQPLYKVTPVSGETLPHWAIEMYGDHPNIWQVDDEYRIWRQTHPEEKTTYTQYYKKWRRALEPFINNQGYEQRPTDHEKIEFSQRLEALKKNNPNVSADRNLLSWTNIGPFETFNTNTGPDPLAKSSQVNVYCFDQSLSKPDIVYCGTEGSEVYKSIDRGLNWTCISRNIDISAVTAIEVDPINPDIVFIGENNRIRKSIDGGLTWNIVMADDNMYTNEILINPAIDTIILAATQNGLYRSGDGGKIWTRLLPEASYDVEWKTDDPSIAFLVRNDPAAGICRFYKSDDAGITWTLKDNGWFFSDLEGRNDGGAKLAVTNADPNRIYAVLIGEAKTDDSGFIGIWRSDDAGETWTMPNPPAGGPWDEINHPNMATIGHTGGYHQGFYNLGFDASDTNPDQLLAGFMSLWYSTDGAATFTCFGGYCGNSFNYVHPDCQDIEINGDDVWMTSDGGIEYSTDFFNTHYARNRGITGSDFWGFGTGWNEDIFVGGRYHNGNTAWYENWMPGECLSLGGGEAPTGYVNPGLERTTYYSDIGGVVLPESQNGNAEYFSIGKYPSESYYDAESGEMEFYSLCWNIFFVTNENKIWKTGDGGVSWNILHEFGTDINARALSFEISRSNPKVMYLFQRAAYSWDPGLLWKTEDGGETWNMISLPPGYARRCLIALSPIDENIIWAAYPDGNDGEKIFTSKDGGETWENLTTSALNGEHITSILYQGDPLISVGGLYLGTFRTIWVKGDEWSEWSPYNDGLPVQISTCILRPFYRDHKIRLGAYGKGIWEAPLYFQTDPILQPMANKLETSCPGDTILFDDYSMRDQSWGEFRWDFEGGTPSESNLRNPKVVFKEPGEYNVGLSIVFDDIIFDKGVYNMIHILEPEINPVPPLIDFSTSDHFTIINPDNGITWVPIELTSCDPEGNWAYYVDNYDYSSYGRDEIQLPVNLDLTNIQNPTLNFSVAYAPYFDGNAFIDSLKVLLTNNCGRTIKTIFRSGGEELSTITNGNGHDSLYMYDRFTPRNCEEWRHISLDLSEYEGQYVTISFLNQSGYGNNMYLDDILLSGLAVATKEPGEVINFQLHPNPTSNSVVLSGNDIAGSVLNVGVYSTTGIKLIEKEINPAEESWEESLSIEKLPTGVYFVKVSSEESVIWTEKLIKI